MAEHDPEKSGVDVGTAGPIHAVRDVEHGGAALNEAADLYGNM
jgi:hypothetical protein